MYDISVSLGKESVDYPGDTPFARNHKWTLEDSGICYLSRLEMSAHSGTHIDSPAHFLKGGKTIDEYGVENFILPARIVNIKDPHSVKAEEISSLQIKRGEALLFRTGNSVSRRCCSGTFTETFTYITPEAAQLCSRREVALIGLDYITVEQYGSPSFETHKILLGNDVFILEGIDFLEVPEGLYTLFCQPLKIEGGEASPVRAFLIERTETNES